MNAVSYSLRRLFALMILPAARAAGSAAAATHAVTSAINSGPGSLRQTLAEAQSGDTIGFAVTGTIVVTELIQLFNANLTIQGPRSTVLAILGDDNSGIFRFERGISIGNKTDRRIMNTGTKPTTAGWIHSIFSIPIAGMHGPLTVAVLI